MVGGLSKLFHLSDPLVGFLSTSFSSVSRIFYVSFKFLSNFKSTSVLKGLYFLTDTCHDKHNAIYCSYCRYVRKRKSFNSKEHHIRLC